MKCELKWLRKLATFSFILSAVLYTGADVRSQDAEVDGVMLHYMTTGHGPAVILLPGYTQTSRIGEADHPNAG